jgi:hypothetical protein
VFGQTKVWIACFAFALAHFGLCEGTRLVYQADDYIHLLAEAQHGAWDFSSCVLPWMSRVPIWAVNIFALFAGPAVLQGALIFLYGLCHVVALVSIADWLRRQFFEYRSNAPTEAWGFGVVTILASCPTSNEILYWRTCMPYALGGVFVGQALHARRWIPRLMWLVAATLTYETFFLPAFALLCLERPKKISKTQHAAYVIRTAAVAGGVVWTVRSLAAIWVGEFTHLLAFSWQNTSHRIEEAFRFTFALNTPFGISVLAFLGVCLRQLPVISRPTRRLGFLLGAGLLATAPYWMLEYSAPRAMYGLQLAYGAAVVAVAWQAWVACANRVVLWSMLAVVACACVMEQGQQFMYRRHNSRAVQALELRLTQDIRDCQAPCVLHHKDFRALLAPGWVLPPFAWEAFLTRLALQAKLTRPASYVVENLSKDSDISLSHD